MRRSDYDERGAFLILWAFLVLGVLAMVAIVIDLGHMRETRRQAQRTADLAATSAGELMAGGDVIGACKAAVTYVKTNASLSSLAETCASDLAGLCDPATPKIMTTTSGPFVITIQSPVLDTEIADPHYPSGVLATDGLPCERMRISIEETNPALFAGVVGVDDITARASAVIRGFIGTNPTQNAGLVVLERRGCEALRASGGQASVLVKGSIAADGSARPGVIQVDTKALAGPGPLCSSAGGDIPAKYAVYGTKLTPSADRPNQPSIEAQAIGGVPGRIDLFALAEDPTTIHAVYDVPGGGVRPAPTPGVIASRNVVDKVYNPPGSGGTPGRVSALKTASSSLVASLVNAAAAAPCAGTCNAVLGNDGLSYTVYPPGTPGGPDVNGVAPLATTSGTPACDSTDATPIEVPASYARVFVNCDTLNVVKIRFAGARVVLKGRLQIGSNRVAAFPNAVEVVVGGCGGCSPPAATTGIDVDGVLLLNSGFPTAPLSATCSDGIDNDADGRTDYDADPAVGDSGCLSAADWDERSCLQDRVAPAVGPSRLVVNTGSITTSSSSVVQMCQTFVLLADGASLPHQDVSATTDLTCAGDVDLNGAFVPQPCPINNPYKGFLSLFGTIDWVAANQNSGERDTTQPNQHFEDLALWTEASAQSEIKGAGNSVTGGVYFFPNATVNFSGQATQLIDLNAQFLARRLLLSGQGTLSMQPNPNDTVDTPAPYFALIR